MTPTVVLLWERSPSSSLRKITKQFEQESLLWQCSFVVLFAQARSCSGSAHLLSEKPLYEAIVTKCREMKIAGATVLRGLEGYGGSTEMHRGT